MDFFEAIKAMDEGKTVRMMVNPEKIYRLASDGETIVSKPINSIGLVLDEDWRSAVFFSRHIRGDWTVVEYRDARIVP